MSEFKVSLSYELNSQLCELYGGGWAHIGRPALRAETRQFTHTALVEGQGVSLGFVLKSSRRHVHS